MKPLGNECTISTLRVPADDTVMVKIKPVTSHSLLTSLTVFIGNHDWGQADSPALAIDGPARLKPNFPSVFDQRLIYQGELGFQTAAGLSSMAGCAPLLEGLFLDFR